MSTIRVNAHISGEHHSLSGRNTLKWNGPRTGLALVEEQNYFALSGAPFRVAVVFRSAKFGPGGYCARIDGWLIFTYIAWRVRWGAEWTTSCVTDFAIKSTYKIWRAWRSRASARRFHRDGGQP